MSFITVDPKYPVYDGIPLTFRAPCDSKDAEGLLVANTKYYFRDANSDDVTGINRLFSVGAYVSVTLDTTKKYAYITNAVTNYSNTVAGDILETVRTDLGDRWLLCNGDILWDGQYPKLREILPYNTGWHMVAPFHTKHQRVRALPKDGFWALESTSEGKFAVYDTNTDTVTDGVYPKKGTINPDNTDNSLKFIGFTHDGDRYILGVSEAYFPSTGTGTGTYRVHLLTSTDLVNWTKVYKFSTSSTDEPYDITFNGVDILVATQYYNYANNPDETYRVCVFATNKAMTTTRQVGGYWKPKYLSDFSVLPNGYWTFQRDGNTACSVYKSGAHRNVFSFSYNGGIAFFNDKYWVGTPYGNQYVIYIETYNFETDTRSYFTVESLFESSDTIYLRGVEYDKNKNEWMLYISNSDADVCYIAYISADSDPSDAANYRTVRVESLPELHNVQMAPDRSKMTAGNLLRDPNQKYLPKHSGDTLKYIYTG